MLTVTFVCINSWPVPRACYSRERVALKNTISIVLKSSLPNKCSLTSSMAIIYLSLDCLNRPRVARPSSRVKAPISVRIKSFFELKVISFRYIVSPAGGLWLGTNNL